MSWVRLESVLLPTKCVAYMLDLAGAGRSVLLVVLSEECY